MVELVRKALAERNVSGNAKVAVMGLSSCEFDDTRNSPSLVIIDHLEEFTP